MPNENPKFVRLCNRLTRGMMADVQHSGWSIAGMDVKPFPDAKNKAAVKYVRKALKEGYLEPASRAEYDEIREISESLDGSDEHIQEGRFQEQVRDKTEAVEKARSEAVADPGDDDDSDEEDDSSDDDSDDDEDDDEEPAPAKKATKKVSKKKK
jgi:hypothetical protein